MSLVSNLEFRTCSGTHWTNILYIKSFSRIKPMVPSLVEGRTGSWIILLNQILAYFLVHVFCFLTYSLIKGRFTLGFGLKKLQVQKSPMWTFLLDSRLDSKLELWYVKLGSMLRNCLSWDHWDLGLKWCHFFSLLFWLVFQCGSLGLNSQPIRWLHFEVSFVLDPSGNTFKVINDMLIVATNLMPVSHQM